MVERFNGRIEAGGAGHVIGAHDALERLLQGNKLADKPELANPTYLPLSPCDPNKAKVAAQLTIHSAKDVSPPDS